MVFSGLVVYGKMAGHILRVLLKLTCSIEQGVKLYLRVKVILFEPYIKKQLSEGRLSVTYK